jgi:hypothetical protein
VSKEELVSSYLAGRISRRMFVRGLVTVGVSLTAAVAYSDVLAGAAGAPMHRAGTQVGSLYKQSTQYNQYPAHTSTAVAGASAARASEVTSVPRFTG